jgi:16S rRNA (cytidine1402-2'-O)-methyltransferase
VALVTDAGTPGVSDPGTELIDACVQIGISVDPVPGASAPLAAAVASGFPLIPLTIFGFPPRRSKDRTRWFERLASLEHTVSFFESPRRVASTLAELDSWLVDRPIVLGRELTKRHQEFLRGDAHTVIAQLRQPPRGEFTVVVGPLEVKDLRVAVAAESSEIDAAVSEFLRMPNIAGLTRRAAIAAVARKYKLPSSVLYGAVERAKRSG